MKAVLILALTASLLQGCLGIYTNNEIANDPFPKVPTNPDGVCPYFTGIYPIETFPEDAVGFNPHWTQSRSIPSPLFGRLIDPELDRKKEAEMDRMYPYPKPRPARKFISFSYPDPEVLEMSYWSADGLIYSTQVSPKKMYEGTDSVPSNKSNSSLRIGPVICDRGTIYRTIDSESRGTEGGKTSRSLDTLSKSASGELVYTVYDFSRLHIFGVVPMGGSRTITTYRYPPYTGPLPGKNP